MVARAGGALCLTGEADSPDPPRSLVGTFEGFGAVCAGRVVAEELSAPILFAANLMRACPQPCVQLFMAIFWDGMVQYRHLQGKMGLFGVNMG